MSLFVLEKGLVACAVYPGTAHTNLAKGLSKSTFSSIVVGKPLSLFMRYTAIFFLFAPALFPCPLCSLSSPLYLFPLYLFPISSTVVAHASIIDVFCHPFPLFLPHSPKSVVTAVITSISLDIHSHPNQTAANDVHVIPLLCHLESFPLPGVVSKTLLTNSDTCWSKL